MGKNRNTTKDIRNLGTMVEENDTMRAIRETASRIDDSVRSMLAASRQQTEANVTFHFEKWLKNEGEQLLHPVTDESQLFPRARYCLTQRPVMDACQLFGPKLVLESIAQAWWNSEVPAQWRPFYAVLVESAEHFWNEPVVISETIKLS